MAIYTCIPTPTTIMSTNTIIMTTPTIITSTSTTPVALMPRTRISPRQPRVILMGSRSAFLRRRIHLLLQAIPMVPQAGNPRLHNPLPNRIAVMQTLMKKTNTTPTTGTATICRG